jgi:Domain of unknown function (DUF5658)
MSGAKVMGRRFLASCLSVLIVSAPAAAAASDNALPLSTAVAASATEAAVAAERTDAAPDAAAPTFAAPATVWTPASRPAALPALYAGSAALQAFDAFSTMKALRQGATEANPVMRGVVGNPAMLIGVKAGVTAASILAAERLWRQHHQMHAVILMAVSNGVMAAVAAHNASVVNSLNR